VCVCVCVCVCVRESVRVGGRRRRMGQTIVNMLVDLLPNSVWRPIDAVFNQCGITTPSEEELEAEFQKHIAASMHPISSSLFVNCLVVLGCSELSPIKRTSNFVSPVANVLTRPFLIPDDEPPSASVNIVQIDSAVKLNDVSVQLNALQERLATLQRENAAFQQQLVAALQECSTLRALVQPLSSSPATRELDVDRRLKSPTCYLVGATPYPVSNSPFEAGCPSVHSSSRGSNHSVIPVHR
jgi:hypothetical protein